MRPSKSGRRDVPTVAPSENYLPGLAPPDAEANPPARQSGAPRSGWWVKRSERQTTDAAGEPVGFRHQLMHGRKTTKSGIGADCARTFQQQANFLNTRDERAAPMRNSR